MSWPPGDRLFLPSEEPEVKWDAFMINCNSQAATSKKNEVKRLQKGPKMRRIQPNIKINQLRPLCVQSQPSQSCCGSSQFVSLAWSVRDTHSLFTKALKTSSQRAASPQPSQVRGHHDHPVCHPSLGSARQKLLGCTQISPARLCFRGKLPQSGTPLSY